MKIEVSAPDWMDVDELKLWVNGELHSIRPVDRTTENDQVEILLDVESDSWVVAEVAGDTSMFPLYVPVDQPPILLGDAIDAFAGPLGFGEGGLGDLAETRMGPALPVAITNPIWLDVDGDGFTAPGFKPQVCDEYEVVTQSAQQALENGTPRMPSPRMRPTFGLPKIKGDIFDVRTVFDQFGRHQH